VPRRFERLKDLDGLAGDPRVDMEVSSGAVCAHVGKILASKEFVHADSLRRFLSYPSRPSTVNRAV
jgi:hypothetical protein